MGLHSHKNIGGNKSTHPSVAISFSRESHNVEYLVASEVIPQRVVRSLCPFSECNHGAVPEWIGSQLIK